jgi:hypothetical protein
MLDSFISMLYHHRLIKVKAKKTSTYRPVQSKSPATTYSTTRPRRPLATAAATFAPPLRPAYFDADLDSGGRRGNTVYCKRPMHKEDKEDRVLAFFSSPLNWDPPPLIRRRVCRHPSFGSGGGTHSLAGEGAECPNSSKGTGIVALLVYMYFVDQRICKRHGVFRDTLLFLIGLNLIRKTDR